MRDYRYHLYEQTVDTRGLDNIAQKIMQAGDEYVTVNFRRLGEIPMKFDQEVLASLVRSMASKNQDAERCAQLIESDQGLANRFGALIFLDPDWGNTVGVIYQAKAGKIDRKRLQRAAQAML